MRSSPIVFGNALELVCLCVFVSQTSAPGLNYTTQSSERRVKQCTSAVPDVTSTYFFV